MNSLTRRPPFQRILVDMNTQFDFLLPRGTLPVSNRADIIPNIRKLMNWGRIEQIPILSTLESHREGEVLKGLPPYCVDNSTGQRKLPFTLMARRLVLFGDNTLDVPLDPFRKYQQLVFTKRNRDFLSNPKADRLVNSIRTGYFAVFGVVTEHCVKAAALGLMARQHRVVVVSDACGYWGNDDHDLALRQVEAKGAILVTTEELISGAAEERIAAAPRLRPICEDEPPLYAAAGDDRSAEPRPSDHAPLRLPAVKANGVATFHAEGNGHSNGNGQSEKIARRSKVPARVTAARSIARKAAKLPRDLA